VSDLSDLERANLRALQMELVAYRAIERMKQRGIVAGDYSASTKEIMNEAATASRNEIENVVKGETNWRVD
jgi:hypothetical protein